MEQQSIRKDSLVPLQGNKKNDSTTEKYAVLLIDGSAIYKALKDQYPHLKLDFQKLAQYFKQHHFRSDVIDFQEMWFFDSLARDHALVTVLQILGYRVSLSETKIMTRNLQCPHCDHVSTHQIPVQSDTDVRFAQQIVRQSERPQIAQIFLLCGDGDFSTTIANVVDMFRAEKTFPQRTLHLFSFKHICHSALQSIVGPTCMHWLDDIVEDITMDASTVNHSHIRGKRDPPNQDQKSPTTWKCGCGRTAHLAFCYCGRQSPFQSRSFRGSPSGRGSHRGRHFVGHSSRGRFSPSRHLPQNRAEENLEFF